MALAIVALSVSTAGADCPPDHAAMGHCTPEPAPVVATAAAPDACTAEHAAMGHCTPSSSTQVAADRAVDEQPSIRVSAIVGLVAATYRSPLFDGSYRGAKLGASIARGRFALSAEIVEYQLTRNGRTDLGPGDVMLHLHGSLWRAGSFSGGAMLMASIPTGDADRGFGMGHVMLMPEAWATWSAGSISVDAAAGYGYAFGGASAHAEHGGGGAWPLVDPMNAREIMFAGGATYRLAKALGAGVHAFGAAPIGDGSTRLALAGRIAWTYGRAITTFEIAGGVVGDPFGLRGILGTTIRVR